MKIYLGDHNNVLVDLKEHFELVESIAEAEAVVLWQDVVSLSRSIVRLAHSEGKKVIIVQHGRHSTMDYCPPANYQFISDKICVWGQQDVDRLLDNDFDKDKIVLTGTTVFSHLKSRRKHEGKNVVFVLAHQDCEIEENKEVAEALRKIKGIKVITKGIDVHEANGFDNYVSSHRDEDNHLDICADVLRDADIVVSIKDDTFSLLAYSLDIPVIIPKVWKSRTMLGRESQETYTDACELVDLQDLEKAIKRTLKNPDKRKEQRRKVAINEGGVHIINPLKNIIDVIK